MKYKEGTVLQFNGYDGPVFLNGDKYTILTINNGDYPYKVSSKNNGRCDCSQKYLDNNFTMNLREYIRQKVKQWNSKKEIR